MSKIQAVTYADLRPGDVIQPWGGEVHITGTWTVMGIDVHPITKRVTVTTDRGEKRAAATEAVKVIRPEGS